MSRTVAFKSIPGFSFIRPCSCKRSSALASFVVSFGIAIVAPLVSAARDFVFPG